MDAKDLSDYGGAYSDAKPVQDPTTQVSAAYFNRMAEDLAQLTRMAPKAIIRWTGTASAGNITLNSADVRTLWGNGLSYAPTVSTAGGTGPYTVTFPTTYTDGLGNVETFNAYAAQIFTGGGTSGALQGGIELTSANVITIYPYNQSGTASSWATDTITLVVW